MDKIAIFNMKGGVGKSAITILLASELTYFDEKKVAVIDADFPQFPIDGLRKRETLALGSQSSRADKLVILPKDYPGQYPIINFNVNKFAKEKLTLSDLIFASEKKGVEYLFFDFGGNMDSQEISKGLTEMDYVFIPTNLDNKVFISTIQTIGFLSKNFPNIQIAYFWNKMPYQDNPILREKISSLQNTIKKKFPTILNISEFIKNYESHFRNEFNSSSSRVDSVFVSTLFRPNPTLATKTNFSGFLDEFKNIINFK